MPGETTIQLKVKEYQELLLHKQETIIFEKLYLLLYKDLHRFAFRIIKSRHIAEEIVSDVFLQLWKKKEDIARIKNLRVFCYVAVKNQSLTYLYKARKNKVCWIEEYANASQIRVKYVQADDELVGKETHEQLQHAIKKLPHKCKAVFKLVKEDGLKYAEAARILNLSVKTIENQMAIALKKISTSLKSHYQAS